MLEGSLLPHFLFPLLRTASALLPVLIKPWIAMTSSLKSMVSASLNKPGSN